MNSPMSIVFCIPPSEVANYTKLYQSSVIRPNMKITYYVQNDPNLYPVNYLRNRAIKQVSTTHFYLSDMDVWPSSPILCVPTHS